MNDNLLVSDDTIVIDPNTNYLEMLVGDNAKFKTAEDLAKGKFYADETIRINNKRMDEMRQTILQLQKENNTKARLEDLIDQANQKLASSEQPPAKEDNKPAFDPEQLDSLVAKKLEQIEAKRKGDLNFNTVLNKVQEQYGENYSKVLKQKSNELGFTDEDVNTLARKSPEAFYKTFGLEQQRQQDTFQAPMRSDRRNDSFSPNTKPGRTWSYYQELKKKDPLAYLDPKIGAQMAKDAVDMGPAFRDGDYYVKGLHEDF